MYIHKNHTFSYMQTYLHICTHTDRHIHKHIPFVFSLVRWKSEFMNREHINSIVLNCGRYVSVEIIGMFIALYISIHIYYIAANHTRTENMGIFPGNGALCRLLSYKNV